MKFILPPLGCLLLLNHPKVVRLVHVPHYRRFMGGKSRQVREHTEITVDLSATEIVRYIADQRRNSEAARRRRHEVRGHFAHDQVAREAPCVHAWVRDDSRRWHCANCMGRRWWTVEHERGDQTLGRVTKPYIVTSHIR